MNLQYNSLVVLAQTVLLTEGHRNKPQNSCFFPKFSEAEVNPKSLTFNIYPEHNKCVGKTKKCAKLMALGHGSGGLVGNKAINLDFLAPFLYYFFLALKESK
jgi:hypothetical protein